MMSTIILDCLRDSDPLANLFWDWCEFGVIEEKAPDWFAMESGTTLQVVGKDASGGRFCLFPASADYSGRLLFVDSEGQAGVIGDSLSEAIRMMIALPYWRDCLKFSGGGNIEEMKKAHAYSECEMQKRFPNIIAVRQSFYQSFGLSEMCTPLETLHRTVLDGAIAKVIGTRDHLPLEGLFNTFVL